MDVVYLNRDGENPELRYSLRSLANVPHENVWIFGGAPTWLNSDTTLHVRSPQMATPYSSTRKHLTAALDNPAVSDPFLLMNDDFYALEPVDGVETFHRGLMSALLRDGRPRTPWERGLHDTLHLLSKTVGIKEPLSYDLHVPLVVDKREMREALRLSKQVRADAIHLRSIYGNIAKIGGRAIDDPKMIRGMDPFPNGPWVSSGTNTFRGVMEPVLRYLFPNPSIYERI